MVKISVKVHEGHLTLPFAKRPSISLETTSSFSYTLKEVRSVNSAPTERMVSAYLNGRNDGVELPFYDHDLSPLMK